MTEIGKNIFVTYSIIALLIMFISTFKEGEKQWQLALIIPILIFLLNV